MNYWRDGSAKIASPKSPSSFLYPMEVSNCLVDSFIDEEKPKPKTKFFLRKNLRRSVCFVYTNLPWLFKSYFNKYKKLNHTHIKKKQFWYGK